MHLYILEKIKSLKIWWKYLIFASIILIYPNICNGQEFINEFYFDSHSTGEKVNLVTEDGFNQFASTSEFTLFSTATSSSASTSIKVDNNFGIRYWADALINSFEFYYTLDSIENNLNCTQVYFFNLEESLHNLQINLCNGTTYDDISVNASSTTKTIKANNSLNNGWHKIKVDYFSNSNFFQFWIDDVLSSEILTSNETTSELIDYIYINGNNYTYNAYFDSFIINNGVNSGTLTEMNDDFLILHEPFYNQYYNNPNIIGTYYPITKFKWDYTFHIGLLSKETYSTYSIYTLIWEIDADGNKLATTSEFLRANVPMTEIDNTVSYRIQVSDNSRFENRMGAYSGIIALIGDDDYILASQNVGFTVYGDMYQDKIWCQDLCMASTTPDGFFESFKWGFNCGSKYIVCYLFSPPPSVIQGLSDSWADATSSFPISVGYDIINPIITAGDINASTSTVYNLAPLKWWNGSSYANTGQSLLTNKTLENGMGSYLYGIYWTWFNRILWILLFLYIFIRLLKISGGFHAEFRLTEPKGEEKERKLIKRGFFNKKM